MVRYDDDDDYDDNDNDSDDDDDDDDDGGNYDNDDDDDYDDMMMIMMMSRQGNPFEKQSAVINEGLVSENHDSQKNVPTKKYSYKVKFFTSKSIN